MTLIKLQDSITDLMNTKYVVMFFSISYSYRVFQ